VWLKPLSPVMVQLVEFVALQLSVVVWLGPMVEGVAEKPDPGGMPGAGQELFEGVAALQLALLGSKVPTAVWPQALAGELQLHWESGGGVALHELTASAATVIAVLPLPPPPEVGSVQDVPLST